ncbi:mRNA-degrading endonuclease RelE of RelBE toxin-antitoxin system [Methanocalculus alkaliphilus]|uniref:type II toxin-antitoxin system RelE family toxin n=1 Tax=Methanocalculus alkaliphilus TaxID=768730 RepID=UPI00209F838E|nr:hypothetical protein [Methanocalculus alkaliphilus]MCP1715640.1 mRNA-degrading endonuclease RelE of RelBE toxin-antitoxin system [Methanocalculus alkaliphilus]
MKYRIHVSYRVEQKIGEMPAESVSAVLDDLEGFADGLDYHRYNVRKLRESCVVLPRYRMHSGNYRLIFFILHNRLIIEVISVRQQRGEVELLSASEPESG